MSDRWFFECPECREEIIVGGGFNDGDDGIIKCFNCKNRFRMEVKLVKINPGVGRRQK